MIQSSLAIRRQTRQIHVGPVAVGGGAPVSVQSMTTTKTADVDGTLSQIYGLAAAGADIVRCTCNEPEAAEGLARIVPRSPVPIIADIHFHHEMALAALEAGVQGLRLNPGNLRKEEEIKQVASEAKDRGVPIRIGVNAGSLDKRLYKQFGGATPEALVESARIELAFFEEVGFEDVKISVKASNVPLMIDAYRLASETFDHPLHLGVTEAGPPPAGSAQRNGGHRDAPGRRDRRHDQVLADRRSGRRGAGWAPAARGARAPRAQGSRPDRMPVLRKSGDRRDRSGEGSARSARGAEPASPGRGHGLRGERAGRSEGGGSRHRRRPAQGSPVHQGRDREGRARGDMVSALVEEAERLVAEGSRRGSRLPTRARPQQAEADRAALLEVAR